MKNPKAIIIGSGIGLTLVIWFLVYLAVKATSFTANSHPESPAMGGDALFEQIDSAIKKSMSNLGTGQASATIPDERFPGACFNTLIRLDSMIPGRDNYLFDFGEAMDKNRFSAFIDPNEKLHFCAVDEIGRRMEVEVSSGLGSFGWHTAFVLKCEYGYTNDFSFIRVGINGTQMAEQIQRPPLNISKTIKGFHGNVAWDLARQNGGAFLNGGFALYALTLDKLSEQQNLKHFNEQAEMNRYGPRRSYIIFNGSNGIIGPDMVFIMGSKTP